MKEARGGGAEWNIFVFTDKSGIFLQHHDDRFVSGKTMRENAELRNAQQRPVSGILLWGGIIYHSRTSLVCIVFTSSSQRDIFEVFDPGVLPYLQCLVTAKFQQDNARTHVTRIVQNFFVFNQIELLPWLGHSPDLSAIENMLSRVAHQLTHITPPSSTPDPLWQLEEAAWSSVPQEHIQKSL
ncbi:transposable element Tcb1 transposase [Trichonephila clavipes]|nr:transposable element Tcb1 transposase [Trichonephila clavipes]